jgi:hypothetical protein
VFSDTNNIFKVIPFQNRDHVGNTDDGHRNTDDNRSTDDDYRNILDNRTGMSENDTDN